MIAQVERGALPARDFERWLAEALSEGRDVPLPARRLRTRLFTGVRAEPRMRPAWRPGIERSSRRLLAPRSPWRSSTAPKPGRGAPLRARAKGARGTRPDMRSGSRRAGRRAAPDPSVVRRARRASGASIPGPAGYAGGAALTHSGESCRVRAVGPVALWQRLEVAGGREQRGGDRARRRHAGELGVARQELGHDLAVLLRLE